MQPPVSYPPRPMAPPAGPGTPSIPPNSASFQPRGSFAAPRGPLGPGQASPGPSSGQSIPPSGARPSQFGPPRPATSLNQPTTASSLGSSSSFIPQQPAIGGSSAPRPAGPGSGMMNGAASVSGPRSNGVIDAGARMGPPASGNGPAGMARGHLPPSTPSTSIPSAPRPFMGPPPTMNSLPTSYPQTPQGPPPRPMGPQTPQAPRPMMAQPQLGTMTTPSARPMPTAMMGPPRPMMTGQVPPGSSHQLPPGTQRPPSPSMTMSQQPGMIPQQRPPSMPMQQRPPSPGGPLAMPRGPGMVPTTTMMPPPMVGGPPRPPGPVAMGPRPMTPGPSAMAPPGVMRPTPTMAPPSAGPIARPMMQQPAVNPNHPAVPPRLHQQPQQQPMQPAQTRTPRPNLEQVSSPIQIMSSQVEQHTNCLQPFPPASVPYVCVDNGQANCRFMRPTTRLLACSSQVVEEMKLPLAVLCTPFADLVPGEVSPVPLSEWTHDQGPVRCTRCKAYLNCYTRASQDFSKWECSLCGHGNDTPAHYRAFAQGGQAPELRFASVEFEVPAVFFADKRVVQGVHEDFCFVIDCTQSSQQSGLFSFTLRTILILAKQAAFPTNARIGLVCFDELNVYFYDQSSVEKGGKPRILISGDCEEGFSPLPAEGLMIPCGDLQAIDALIQFVSLSMQQQQQPQQQAKTTSNVGGCALMSAFSAMRDSAGRIVLLLSSMPTKGQGKLAEREQPAVIGTETEMTLFSADKEEKFYNELSIRCLQSSIAVDIFACGALFMDAAALCQMPSTTGGVFERIPGFQAANPIHRFELETKLSKTLKRARAMCVAMKARTSSGLRVTRYIGHGFPDEGSYKISSMSADYCLAVELEHDGTKLEDSKSRGIVQLALLYVTPDGKRRLRVHNMAMQAKESSAIVLNAFDPLAVACYWAKLVSLELAELSLTKARDALVKRLMDALRSIQKLGSGGRRPAGGEPLELITLYALSLLKSPALMLNRPLDRGVREPYARADARIASRFHMLWSSPEAFSRQVYPFLFDLSDQEGTLYGESLPVVAPSVSQLPDSSLPQQRVRLPPRLPCSSEFLRAEGVFLLYDGGDSIDMFIGSRANPQLVEKILGMIPTPEVKVGMVQERNKSSQAVHRVCKQLLEDFGGISLPHPGQPIPVQLASGASPEFFTENKQFLAKLVEDKVYAEQSYGSFVTHVFQLMKSDQ